MNVNMLKVMNEVHKLGLTKQHWELIKEERKLLNKQSIKLIKVKKSRKYNKDYYTCVCVDHAAGNFSNTKDLVIKQIEAPGEGSAKWRRPQDGDEIILNTLVPNDVEIPAALHTLQYLNDVKDSRRYNLQYVGDSKERLIQIFSQSFNGWKKLGVYDGCNYHDEMEHMQGNKAYNAAESKRIEFQNNQLQSIFELFEEKPSEIDISKSRFNVGLIVKVFQVKNRRLAVMIKRESYHDTIKKGLFQSHYKMDRVCYFLMGFTPLDSQYNYVAPGRELIIHNGLELYVDDDLTGKIDSNDLYGYTAMASANRNEYNDTEDKFILLTADKYMKDIRKVKQYKNNMNTQEANNQAKKTLTHNIKKAFSKGKVVRHGITFRSTSIEYEGLKIIGPGIKEFCVKGNIVYQETPDFIQIWESYVEHALGLRWDYNCFPKIYSLSDNEVTFKIGRVKMHVKFKARKQYINGFLIHGKDAPHVCRRAIRYKTQEEFDKYLQFTEEYNLDIQDWFNEGYISFDIPTNAEDCDLSLDEKLKAAIPIKLDEDNKMVITVGKNQYFVKNKKSLLKLSSGYYNPYYKNSMNMMVAQLFKAIKVDESDVAILLKDGVNRYREAVAKQKKIDREKIGRSKEFIANAVKISKAERVKGGYLVRGSTKKMYFVEAGLKVYTCKRGKKAKWINDKYLCLIDVGSDTDTKWGKNDALAKRLLMLKEDLVLASDIYNKGDKMDKHWLDLMRGVEI